MPCAAPPAKRDGAPFAGLVDFGAAGGQPHAKNPMGRLGMWMGIQMNTMTDDSASHIAEIVIQGATMGVIETMRDRAALASANAEAQGMAAAFIKAQEEDIEAFKKFL